MKTFRTLFSGGELFGVGARAAGYVHLDGYEIDPKIAAVARLNGFDVRAADVCEVEYAVLPPTDHLHVSPSCKNASQANTKAGESGADLACADAICRAIRAHQGETFTLENVWQYRAFESFDRIRAALTEANFSYDYWHLNSADYGVPQTRKRLILIARRGLCRIQRPHPTHRKGGDMFSPPWAGWYAAIADILHALPPTKLAPWQEARLPKALRETMLFAQNDSQDHDGNSYGATGRSGDDPALTVSTVSAGWWKAFLLGDQAAGVGDLYANAPASAVRASDHNGHMRAFLLESKNANQQYGDSIRDMDEPATTVVTDRKPSHMPKAYLLDGDNASTHHGEPTLRAAHEPAMTVRGGRTPAHRAYAAGHWVRMTIQALGRFQTTPDSYRGLTAEINGNGVPCLLSQRIMESLS